LGCFYWFLVWLFVSSSPFKRDMRCFKLNRGLLGQTTIGSIRGLQSTRSLLSLGKPIYQDTKPVPEEDLYTWKVATDKAAQALFLTELLRGMVLTLSYFFKPKVLSSLSLFFLFFLCFDVFFLRCR
jgi:hypothetical protein